MPPKIRDLIKNLEDHGFKNRGGKGIHRNFENEQTGARITISGNLGDDAKKYQEKEVKKVLKGDPK